MATKTKNPPHKASPRARARQPGSKKKGAFLDPETRKAILDAIGQGLLRQQACSNAGISRRTLRDWELKAEAEPDGDYAAFVDQLQMTQDKAEARLMALHNAIACGVKLPEKIVEELTHEQLGEFRQRNMLAAIQAQLKYGGSRPWAEIHRLEHTGKDGGPIESGLVVEVVQLPPLRNDGDPDAEPSDD